MSTIKEQQIRESVLITRGTASLSQDSTRSQAWTAAGLAMIFGYVDSYALLKFGVYASFMSGNTTSAGLHVGQTNLSTAAHSLLPIPSFVLGVFIGTLLMHSDAIHGLTKVSALVAAMLTIGVAASYFAWRDWFSILVLSAAMGIMNTSITRVGKQSVSLGFVTGDLNYLGQHLAMGVKRRPVGEMQGPWDTHWMRAALLAGIWTAFFVGAVLGAAVAAHLASWTLLLPAFVLIVFALLHRAAISGV